MSIARSASVTLLAGFFAVAMIVSPLSAQPAAPSSPVAAGKSIGGPPMPIVKSPVDLFRDLLAMTPAARKNYLTNRPPEMRSRILDKLKEYEALDPNERELRLRATELRWYLPPLMHATPKDRAARLAVIPEEMRKLVENRLTQWDLLPPPLQQQLLGNEQALGLFTHIEGGGHRPASQRAGGDTNQYSWNADLARWNALPEEKRQSLTAQFSHFFDLTPSEKNKTLKTLSEPERQQMEKTLLAFEKLPRAQRLECIRSFEQFSSMSGAEKVAFLKNAERWSQMPPAERETWRKLVARVPQWPPMPPGMQPPGSPPMPPSPHAAKPAVTLVTNAN